MEESNLSDAEKRQIISTGIGLVGDKFKSHAANIMLGAIAWQESNFYYRKQIGGPARGLWQFEKYGGVRGVMRHRHTEEKAVQLCCARGVMPVLDQVYEALATDDILAAGFARLLLWTDPSPLPVYESDGWQCYLRNWRPGKPHLSRWAPSWEKSKALFG